MAKRCSKCLQWKESDAYHRDRTKAGGLKSQCKACQNAQKKEYRTRQRMKTRAQMRRSYMKAWQPRPRRQRKLTSNARFRRWREKNKARQQAYLTQHLRRWHAENSDKTTTWNKEHHTAATTRRQYHRANAAKAVVNDLSAEDWRWLLDKFDGCCAYCGKTTGKLTADHVVPLAQGGANTLSNVVPACSSCNSRKGARTPEQAEMHLVSNAPVTDHMQQLKLI
jgi:5-methylcytosine-specific restriction endonuclease McrA